MNTSIKPGKIWLDTDENRIQAHGGSLIQVGKTFYWYGENKEKTTGNNKIWHWGVRCYSSADLYNWKSEGIIIPPEPENRSSPLHPERMMDRPHIVYNEKEHQYVAWLKIMGEPPCFAVLKAQDILGPYEMVSPCVNPCGMAVGDFDIAVSEEDKKAYLFSERPHTSLYCADLNSSYTRDTGYYSEHFPSSGPPLTREAPAHFYRKGLHYLITSGTTGYHPNPSITAVSKLWHGPYEISGNTHLGDTSLTSYNSQISSVFRYPGKKDLYIALADRWLPDLPEREGTDFYTGEAYRQTEKRFRQIFDPESAIAFNPEDAREMFINSSESDYVWLPLQFNGDHAFIEWKDEWRTEDFE